MAQRFKAHAALTEDPVWFPESIGWFSTACNSTSKSSDPPLLASMGSCTHMVYINSCRQAHKKGEGMKGGGGEKRGGHEREKGEKGEGIKRSYNDLERLHDNRS